MLSSTDLEFLHDEFGIKKEMIHSHVSRKMKEQINIVRFLQHGQHCFTQTLSKCWDDSMFSAWRVLTILIVENEEPKGIWAIIWSWLPAWVDD
jgi:hypothetical protein